VELKPYLGTYTAHSGPLRNQEHTVVARDGHMAVDLPQGLVADLEESTEEGRWTFAVDPSAAVSFQWDETGQVVAMTLHVAEESFELPRGEALAEPDLDLAVIDKYLGFYRDKENDHTVEVIIHNGRLAIEIPGQLVKLELYAPDEEGRWAIRLNPSVSISFNESADGQVVSFTSHTPEGDLISPRVEE